VGWTRRRNAATRSAFVSHALSWVAFLWLMLWPYSYRGVSVTETVPGGPPGQSTEFHASFVAVNGLWVIPVFLVPVAITALLLAVAVQNRSRKVAALAAWPLVAMLLVFCALGVFSVGLLYLPAALAAGVAAALLLRRRTEVECLT